MEFNLVILLLLTLSAADVHTLEGCSVSAEEGETAILPVKVDLPENSQLLHPIINWKNERGDIVHDYWYDQDDNTFQDERFKGRTSLFKEEIKNGNVSLKISNVTKRDEGNYTCEVQLFKGGETYKVSLCVTVKENHEHSVEIPEPEQPSLTTGQIVGMVIGVLIGLAALICVFLYRRYTLTEAIKRGYHDVEAAIQMVALRGGQELDHSH